MVWLGISVLVASITILFFRHPPSSWTFLPWFRRLEIQDIAKTQSKDAPESILSEEGKGESKDAHSAPNHDILKDSKQSIPIIATTDSKQAVPIIAIADTTPDIPPTIIKDELDRKAMPPPPFKRPPSKLSSPPTTPQALSIPSVTFAEPEKEYSPPRPSFPAMNSIQRTTGGTRGPPRLNALTSKSSGGSLMSPPMLSPLPNRTVSALKIQAAGTAAGLEPPPSHSSVPSKPRKKVLLSPGHSPLDWARLTSSPEANLRGLPPLTPYLKVPPSLLKQYTGRKGKDAWTVLGGKVYNITPYLPYHPGGEPELMKCAGRDGTRLFAEVHPWVNYEGMLEGCLVGLAVEEGDLKVEPNLEEMD